MTELCIPLSLDTNLAHLLIVSLYSYYSTYLSLDLDSISQWGRQNLDNSMLSKSSLFLISLPKNKDSDVLSRCDRVVWLDERHFWTFEAVVSAIGLVAGLATVARQKILDHRVVQRIQRQVAAGV